MERVKRDPKNTEFFRSVTQHSEATYLALTKMQYKQYGTRLKVLIIVLGAIFVLLGVYLQDSVVTVICLLLGCWLMASINYPPRLRAERLVQRAGGKYPTTVYRFMGDRIEYQNATTTGSVDYDMLIRITQDKDNCYLFIANKSAHMIVKDAISPKNFETFSRFIQRRTGLPWYEKKTMFNMTLGSLIRGAKQK